MISDPDLLRVTFERLVEAEVPTIEGKQLDASDVEFRLGFGADRTAYSAVTIEFSVTTVKGLHIRFDITYRLTLTVEPSADDKQIGFDRVFREIAARIGPVIMYPYIRETPASLCSKAGGTPSSCR